MESKGFRNHFLRVTRAAAAPIVGLCLVALLDSRVRSETISSTHLDKAVSIGYILLGIGLAYRLICTIALDVLMARATGRM